MLTGDRQAVQIKTRKPLVAADPCIRLRPTVRANIARSRIIESTVLTVKFCVTGQPNQTTRPIATKQLAIEVFLSFLRHFTRRRPNRPVTGPIRRGRAHHPAFTDRRTAPRSGERGSRNGYPVVAIVAVVAIVHGPAVKLSAMDDARRCQMKARVSLYEDAGMDGHRKFTCLLRVKKDGTTSSSTHRLCLLRHVGISGQPRKGFGAAFGTGF